MIVKILIFCVATICCFATAAHSKQDALPATWEFSFLTPAKTKILIPQMRSVSPLVRTTKGYEIADPVSEISVLRLADIFAEFEFTDEQSSKVKEVLKTAEDLKRQVQDRLAVVNSVPGAKDIKNWYLTEANVVRGQIKEVLLPHQIEIAMEIGERMKLRRLGLQEYLCQLESFGKVSLSKAEKARLREKSVAELGQLVVDCEKKLKSGIDDLLSNLKQESIDGITQLIEVKSGANCLIAFDIFLAQLGMGDNDVRKSSSSFEKLSRPAIYFAGDDGTPRFYARGCGKITCDFDRLGGYESLLQLLCDDQSNLLRLSPSQIERAEQLKLKLANDCVWMDQYISKSPNPWHSSENVVDMQIGMVKDLEKQLSELLTIDQSSVLTKKMEKYSVSRFGLVHEITEGSIKDAFGLTPKEIRSVKKRSKKIFQKLQAQSRAWALDYNEKLIALLDNENKEFVRERIGRPVPVGGSSLFVLKFDERWK